MASDEQIHHVLEKLDALHFEETSKYFSGQREGLKAVIKFLSDNGKKVTAGSISENLNISTARVAVLLRKLEEKNLITKVKSTKDARVTMVALTDEGRKTANAFQKSFENILGALIDKVGTEKIDDFILVLGEIKTQIALNSICEEKLI